MTSASESIESDHQDSNIAHAYERIPIRNIWLLFLYAHNLAHFKNRFDAGVEESPDFKSLIARLLCHVVEERLKRNLSFGYRQREENLKRVRGRINILKTYSHDLLKRGEIACRFEEFTLDTPRNRYVRAALEFLGGQLPKERDMTSHKDSTELIHRVKTLANIFGRIGVNGRKPSRAELAKDQIARHESEDLLMVVLARAVFDLILPTEREGTHSLLQSSRIHKEFPNLFERAVGNILKSELSQRDGWKVLPGKQLKWIMTSNSKFMPKMKTDIFLENADQNRRIIIDTKFTDIITRNQQGDKKFKSANIYQIYSYLRSQERPDDALSLSSEGILLHPSIDEKMDESVCLQGHNIRFCTIDLKQPSEEIIDNLRRICGWRGNC